MGLFDLFGASRRKRAVKAGRAKERGGDLAGAAELYLAAGCGDDAARVMLLRADAEASVERRLSLASAAADAATSEEVKRGAQARKASLSFDVLRRSGTALRSELARVARDLEQAGEHLSAAEAYEQAGDREGRERALTAAGAIELLEEHLFTSQSEERADRAVDLALRRIADLDRTAERRAALELAREVMSTHPNERAADLARGIRARLVRGPFVELEIDGASARVALGDEITIGRSEATIVVASRAVSRKHVRIRRGLAGPTVEDLSTRNGTMLAGARIDGPIPIGRGISIDLGGEVPCKLGVVDAPNLGSERGPLVSIEVAGEVCLASLGPLVASGFRLTLESAGDDELVVLRPGASGARPFLGGFELSPRIELCAGDALAAVRNGAPVLRVLGGSRREGA